MSVSCSVKLQTSHNIYADSVTHKPDEYVMITLVLTHTHKMQNVNEISSSISKTSEYLNNQETQLIN